MGRLTRRDMLWRSGALGCSLAASPLVTPMTFAAAPWDTRLVVIILRGGMDGLDVVQPLGDPNLRRLRTGLSTGADAIDLNGFFAMHPGLASLAPLWAKGQLAFAHAVSTPYRDKRSHFDGQDLLEAGTGFDVGLSAIRDGWLNRMLQVTPGTRAQTAFAIGREELIVLAGDAPVSSWSPEATLDLTPESRELLDLIYGHDPLFHQASREAMAIAENLDLGQAADSFDDMLGGMEQTMAASQKGAEHQKLASFAAKLLRDDTRIAAFSLNGWDTHRGQTRGISRALGALSDTILTLKDGLGPVWDKTAILAMTEFGRTARENGTTGTDHGTAGAMLMAGGAINGGQVYGDWPGLAEVDLYDRRDLMPTQDVRAYAAAALQGAFGLDRGVLEASVFPGLDMGAVPRIIV